MAVRRWRLALASVLLLAALFALVAFNILSTGRRASGGAATAILTIYLGSAQVTAVGSQDSVGALSGAHLREGDRITTGPRSKAAIEFGDGSQTRLDGGTTIFVLKLASSAGSLRVVLRQDAGKSWTRVSAQAPGFEVEAPGKVRATAGGSDFSVYVKGVAGVDVIAWTGTVVVAAPGVTNRSVGARTQVTVRDGHEIASGPVSDDNAGDQFTIFNNAVNQSLAAAPGFAGGPTSVGTGSLAEGGESTAQPGVQVVAGADADVVYSLDALGAAFELVVIDPDGEEFLRRASPEHPFSVVVAKARPGQWQFKVHDMHSAGEQTWVVVVTTLVPSTHEARPFFITGAPCEHTVRAETGPDFWTVRARDASGRPSLVVTAQGPDALPPWATFEAATGSFRFAPPADAASADLVLAVAATFGGQQPATLMCTEHVLAAPHPSAPGGGGKGSAQRGGSL